MNTTLQCHACAAPVPHGHPAHHGMLINLERFLCSRLIADKEMLALLARKRYSSRDGEQRARDEATRAELQAAVTRGVELIKDLRKIEEECYGPGHLAAC